MELDNFSIPKSILNDIAKLKNSLSETGSFILLSGDSGSGRTSLCEHVVNGLEGRFTTVFIPCQAEMSLEQLRSLFLQQISPDGGYDASVSLSQAFESMSIPVRQKLLVVVDDLDLVVDTFTQDLLELFEKNLGENRFSFLVTSHPLWAASKLNSLSPAPKSALSKVREIALTPLTLDEGLSLCEQMFVYAGLDRVYKAILPDLPGVLGRCGGNLTKIIKLSEALMADPAEVNSENTQNTETSAPETISAGAAEKKKKQGGSGLFISIICILIVIACLVPVFLGSSFVDRLLGRPVEHESGVVSTQIDLNETDRLTFGEDETVVGAKPEKSADADVSPLAVASGASSDISAKGPRGDESNTVDDDGALLEKVPVGVEAETAEETAKNSVTIAGSDLDEIEKSGAESNSDDPRRGLAGSVKEQSSLKKEVKEESLKSGTVVLERADNSLHAEEIERERAELEAQRRLEAEAQAFAKEQEQRELQEKLALEKRLEEERIKAQEAQIKALADKLAKQQEEERRKELLEKEKKEQEKASAVKSKPASAPALGRGSEGAIADLSSKNPHHYTLQVQAGRSRASLAETSRYLSGTYWIYATTREGRDWYVLITGDFANPKSAVESARSLPESVRRSGPFAKTFDKVQSEIRAHN